MKRLVELHGGQVSATSAGAGQGARFVIQLPLDGDEPVEPSARTQARAIVAGRRVLVIEDNQDAAESLREALQLDGYDVMVAYDGVAGLEKAREFNPQIVLCDVGLPGMDGYSVAEQFRADPALYRIGLVALTGYVRPEDLLRAQQAGFDRHVAKPPSIEDLERVIEEICGGR